MLSKVLNDAVSDATGDDNSNTAKYITTILLKQFNLRNENLRLKSFAYKDSDKNYALSDFIASACQLLKRLNK